MISKRRFSSSKPPQGGYNRVVNFMPSRPAPLERRSSLLDSADKGGYNRYYSCVDYREAGQGHSFSHDQRSAPFHRDESGYRCSRDDHSERLWPDYRDTREL